MYVAEDMRHSLLYFGTNRHQNSGLDLQELKGEEQRSQNSLQPGLLFHLADNQRQ